MRKKVLKEILELCEKVGTLDELKEALNNLEYGEDVDGKTVKIRMYKDGNGQVKTEILSICDYRDTENMTIEELEEYYRIALLINQSSNREQKAEEMTRIVESAKSETEILAMIKTME